MSYSGPIAIFDHAGYRLESWGNGAAYALTRVTDGASVFMQGDDAAEFRAEYDRADEIGECACLALFREYDDVMQAEPDNAQ